MSKKTHNRPCADHYAAAYNYACSVDFLKTIKFDMIVIRSLNLGNDSNDNVLKYSDEY